MRPLSPARASGARGRTEDAHTAAAVAGRLAVALGAGIPPLAALRYIADDPGSPAALRAAAAAVAPDAVPPLLRDVPGEGWRELAVAWRVAHETGAPLAPVLARTADVLQDLAQLRREVEVALAGPVASGRIVMALPAVAVLFGLLLGLDPIGTLVGTVPGWLCLAAGGGLLVAGARWTRRLIRAARVADPAAGLALDLLAVGLAGGASPDRVVAAVEAALADAGLAPLGDAAGSALRFARAAGAPPAALLRREAEERRRIARTAAQLAAARLGGRLLLPLGLCILPSFVALGVAPLVITIVGSTIAAF